jgi:hypothetical protein
MSAEQEGKQPEDEKGFLYQKATPKGCFLLFIYVLGAAFISAMVKLLLK